MLFAIYMDSIILYSSALLLFYRVFKLTTSLKSAVPERMSAISMLQKLDMSIKGSTVNQKVFPFFIRTPKT